MARYIAMYVYQNMYICTHIYVSVYIIKNVKYFLYDVDFTPCLLVPNVGASYCMSDPQLRKPPV